MNPGERHEAMANAVRFLSMDAVEKANSGHPGMPMGAADVATVLFSRIMEFDPKKPDWPDRDRFVLSAGHGSMLLYSILYLLGYADIDIEQIKRFRQLGSRTPGHPERGCAAGVETTTGPLGQGLANAVGMAMAERSLNARFGDEIVDHRTFCLVGDGCLMEGISHEAVSLAGHLRLAKLAVIWDDNRVSIDGPVSLADSTDQAARFKAAGWAALRVDGHDPEKIAEALAQAGTLGKPLFVAARTEIGFGAPTKQGTSKAHGSPLGEEEIRGARKKLKWSAEPFEVPASACDSWRVAGLRSSQKRKEWEKRFDSLEPGLRGEFKRRMAGELPASLGEAIDSLKREFAGNRPCVATRKASGMVLEKILPVLPEALGGSADLTGSNETKASDSAAITDRDFSGRYVHYGVREHAMAAAMSGMALHGGIIPYGGTFLAFSDYSRPSLRLAALMELRAIHVMTHDSIGLGEDGPTHQPVEHLAALRCIPNLLVLRPADAMETAECWAIALESMTSPSVLALSRQNLDALRESPSDENRCAKGAYEIASASSDSAKASLFASGSEVSVAMEARKRLEAEGIPTRVVSVPCFELFARQSKRYRDSIIGSAEAKVGIEAGIRQGWDSLIGVDGIFIGMEGFGASAPQEKLYERFGITGEAVAEAVGERLGREGKS